MTHSAWKHTEPAPVLLAPAALRLLREIARRDHGHGVAFEVAPRCRYRMVGTNYVVNQRTFYPLTGNGLVTDDGDDDAPVRITASGRAYLAALEVRA
ncbi:hypothetical protein ACFV4E_35910 [Streptomyces hygroscopicus]|uniref:hypothetical protein n=1 Tax=Streptomyces hygroscopicus TaxID=1912 RepID=UPI0036AC4ED5